MKKKPWHVFVLGILFFSLPSCDQSSDQNEINFWENPVEIDLEAIKERGFIRVVVDNSSTSYYIYRGRAMGYEFELLRNLATRLGVTLRIVVSNGLEESFRFLNEGKADIIAINVIVIRSVNQCNVIIYHRIINIPIHNFKNERFKALVFFMNLHLKTQ